MSLEEVAPGLRRWTSFHDHWEEEVASLAMSEDGELPGGIRAFQTPRVAEVVYWLPSKRELERVLGA